MVPDPLLHSLIVSRLLNALEKFAQRSRLKVYIARGAGLTITARAARIPDLLVVSRSRAAAVIAAGGGWLRLSPDLAAEVVLPNEPAAALESSVQRYIERGANSVWVLYPQTRSVVVYRSSGLRVELTEDMVLAESDLLPGFGIPVRDIFPETRSR